MALGLAVVLLCGAEAASAFISANTIDEHATYKKHGTLVRVSGPIACTRGERVAIRVAVRQPATAARARSRWKGRCTGKVQHWQVRARARARDPLRERPRPCLRRREHAKLDLASPTGGDGASA